MVTSLTGRTPEVAVERIVGELLPPPRFDAVRFSTYLPDPQQRSQASAVQTLSTFAERLSEPEGAKRGWFGRKAPAASPAGLYLDGGFGVGKTHLLASLWHAASPPKAFGTFVELTNLVGALGFARTVEELSTLRLLCIDEFELDDPGDTVLISTLLERLAGNGVRFGATSNTLPGALGEGRFAADDFIREIQGLSAHFEVVRIDGDDYRHRGLPPAPPPLSDTAVREAAASSPGATMDDFPALLRHLAQLHPVRYGALLDGVDVVCLTGVAPLPDQSTALRLVVLADRLYDRDIPVVASGVPFDQVFSPEMLSGGYRKKYFRAVSRLVALAREGEGIDVRELRR